MKLMANRWMWDQYIANQCKAVGTTTTSYDILFFRVYHVFVIEWLQFLSVQFGMNKQNFEDEK